MTSRVVLVLIVSFILSACRDDPATYQPGLSIPGGRGVYILNEGLFGQGNAALSYYDLLNGQVYHDVFGRINGRNLGDVGNAMVVQGDLAYIVVNNSHKIEIVTLATCVSRGTIAFPAGTSPRQMVFVNDSIALVTSLTNGEVLVVDVRTRTVRQSIAVGGGPDGLAIAGGKAFVANSEYGVGRTVSVIDVASLSVLQTMEVGDNVYDVMRISDDIIYILCAGFYNDYNDPNDDTPAWVYAMNTTTLSIVDSVFIGDHAFKMAAGGSRCYVPVADTVRVINTQSHTAEGTVANGTFYYGVAVDPVSGDILLADARTYTVPGAVQIYSPGGVLKRQFDAGIIPGAFAFKE